MHFTAALLAAALASSASAKLGFNYGSTFTTGAAKTQSDFEKEFTTAANLKGTQGWTSARLYTMVQGGTASDPISAIPAAIKTKTSLLLGLWASAGETAFANELLALKAAIKQYGTAFTSIVDGISIGSEDLYRNSPQGIAAGSNPGVDPDVLVRYIKQVKDAIAGTSLEGARLGHVDTWTAWDNSSSSVVVDELDWIGMDAYPYFQNTMPNAIGSSKALFDDAVGRTRAASKGKEVWVTETGHPVSGKTSGDSVASVENAERYWKDVGCPMFGNTNVWWYTLQDAAPDTPNPSFGIVGSTLSTTPLYDLSCADVNTKPSSSSSSSSAAPATSTTTTQPSSSDSNSSSKPTDTESTIAPSSSSSPSATETDSSSDSATSTTTTAPDTESTGLSGGSPGGVPSSQLSLEQSATVTPSISTTLSSVPSPTTGSGNGEGDGTSPAPSPTPTTPDAGAAGLRSDGLGAAFVAIMGAILYL